LRGGGLAAKIDGRQNASGLLEEFMPVVRRMQAEGIDPLNPKPLSDGAERGFSVWRPHGMRTLGVTLG
jgi:hypothetical protein